MDMKTRIDFIALDPTVIVIKKDISDYYVELDGVRGKLLPHHTAKNFSANELVTFFVERITDIGVNILASFLYDLIKNGKIKNLRIGKKKVETKEEIIDALEDEQVNSRDQEGV